MSILILSVTEDFYSNNAFQTWGNNYRTGLETVLLGSLEKQPIGICICTHTYIRSDQISRSVVSDSLRPHDRSTPGLPVHHQLPEFTQTQSIESVMPSSRLILCCSLLLLPPIPPSIRVFSNESTLCMRWPKYWSFSFSIIPSK